MRSLKNFALTAICSFFTVNAVNLDEPAEL